MAAKTLLQRAGAPIVTRFLNSGLTHKCPSLTQHFQKNQLFSSSKFSPLPWFSNHHNSSNNAVSFLNGRNNEMVVEEKRLEIGNILNPFGQPCLDFFLPDADDSSSDPMILFPKRTFQPSTLPGKGIMGSLHARLQKAVGE